MNVSTSSIAFLLACALVGGYLWSRRRWAQMTPQRLAELAGGTDPGAWKGSLRELRRRGIDLAPHVTRLAALLLSPHADERESAHSTLTELFPEWQRDLAACGYRPQDPVEVSRPRVQPVFQHLHVPPHP